MARVNISKVVGRRKTLAEAISKEMGEYAEEVQQYIAQVEEPKKSANGNHTVYEILQQGLGTTQPYILGIDKALQKLLKHNALCEYTPATDTAAGSPAQTLVTTIGDLIDVFTHLTRRMTLVPDETKVLSSFRKRKPRVVELVGKLKTGAIAWRAALHAYLQSDAFKGIFNDPEKPFTLYDDEVTGTKAEKKAFFTKHMPDSYAALKKDKKSTRDFVLDQKKFDITGTRYADASEDSREADSDVELESDDYDQASNELDPDASVESESSEDSVGEDDDSAEVSQATGMFEANIKTHNKKIVKQTRHTRTELVPLLKRARGNELDAVRRQRRRRGDDDSAADTKSDDDEEDDEEVIDTDETPGDETPSPPADASGGGDDEESDDESSSGGVEEVDAATAEAEDRALEREDGYVSP